MDILKRHKASGAIRMAVLAFFLAFSSHAGAESDLLQLQEQKIKAGLVYNFLKYTDWQEKMRPGQGNLRVCLIGGDPFDGYLFPLQDRTAQQKTIDIISLREGENTQDCRVVVIHQGMHKALPFLLQSLDHQGVLTISDIPGFSQQGGMVELAKGADKRIHIFINRNSLKAAGLNVQERILKLAELVE